MVDCVDSASDRVCSVSEDWWTKTETIFFVVTKNVEVYHEGESVRGRFDYRVDTLSRFSESKEPWLNDFAAFHSKYVCFALFTQTHVHTRTHTQTHTHTGFTSV